MYANKGVAVHQSVLTRVPYGTFALVYHPLDIVYVCVCSGGWRHLYMYYVCVYMYVCIVCVYMYILCGSLYV